MKAMTDRFTRRERAALRELAATAHERELETALTELYEKFGTWGGEGISAFELNDEIHKFHDGISRELYRYYVMNNPEVAVSIGIARGIVGLQELDEGLREKIAPMAEVFQSKGGADEKDAT
jgi:hypothetical protein